MLDKLLKVLIKDDNVLELINYHKQIDRELRQLYHQEEKAKQECNEKLGKIRTERYRLQEKCQHLAKTFHPDASGNNDSETICDICGKEL